jgi:hypothetical protein
MARFKKSQTETQKESTFNIETSTVDADIEATKPQPEMVVKPIVTAPVVKPTALKQKTTETDQSTNYKIEETVATPDLIKNLVKGGKEVAPEPLPKPDSSMVKHIQKSLGKESPKSDFSAESVFEEAIGKTLEDASDFSVA